MTERSAAINLVRLQAQIEGRLQENDERFHVQAAEKVVHALRWYQPLRWTTPTNLDQLRHEVSQALYTGTSPEITAVYRSIPDPLDLNKAAQDIEDAVPLIRNHFAATEFQRKATELRELAAPFTSQLDEDFTEWSLRTYGTPTADTLTAAEDMWRSRRDTSEQEGPLIHDWTLAAFLQSGLDVYGLTDWRIEPASMMAKVSVHGLEKLIRVQRGVTVSKEEARRLLAHEIGRHVLSMENASKQPDPFARFSLGWQQLATEEGVAAWLETHLFDSPDGDRERLFAARALAASWAPNMGVIDIARQLADTLPMEDAVTVALRVKRGIRSMSQPGGSTKDHQYLTGLLRIQDHLNVHPGDLPKIQATKWSIEHLPAVERGLASGSLLPASKDADLLRHVRFPDGRQQTASSRSERPTPRGWLNRLLRRPASRD